MVVRNEAWHSLKKLCQNLQRMATADPATSVSKNATHMIGLPASFQEMADVVLVVEGSELPAHKAILAANSKVFADLFASQAPSASSKQEVPLIGENLQDTITALTFLYNNCVFSTSTQSINSPEDARPLLKFGHKYGMQGMLDAIETYLIAQVQKVEPDGRYVLMKSNEAVASWTALAEKSGLSKLLAHCENFMIKDDDSNLWHDKALVVDGVSRASLLRILRGLQWSRAKMEAHIKTKLVPGRDYDAGVARLLQWQKNAET